MMARMSKGKKLAIILLLRCLVIRAQFSLNSSNSSGNCDDRCPVCVKTPEGLFHARCKLNDSLKPPSPFVLFKTLDLSNNSLGKVPREFLTNQSRLTTLSLVLNNISTIEDGAFGQLNQVTFVNLSYNPLQRWKGNVTKELPNLVKLDVTGSTWIPNENILQIPSLRTVIGISWSRDCVNCTLDKRNIPFPFNGDNGDFNTPPMSFIKQSFYPNCTSQMCGSITVVKPGTKTEITKNVLSVPKGLFYSSYVMGAIAIVLNFMILVTVLTSKALRQTTSMLLITNMAMCDLLIGIYSVIIGSLNIFNFLQGKQGAQKLLLGGGVLCPLATAIFTSGESVAAVTSLLLTVEKYCSIVHCMKPDHRLTRKVAVLILLPCWVLSLGFAVSPLLHVPLLSFSATMMCSFPVGGKTTFLISVSILVMLYIINIPLYVVIFLFVRRSGSQLGVKREAAILRKIALVVCTNFVLLVTPMVLLITFVPVKNIHNTIVLGSAHDTQVLYIVGFWFPIACLGLNACVNPLLCAFRQAQFTKELRNKFKVQVHAPIRDALSSSRQEGLSSQWNASTSQIVLFRVTRHEA